MRSPYIFLLARQWTMLQRRSFLVWFVGMVMIFLGLIPLSRRRVGRHGGSIHPCIVN